jgi:hypothetical protein
MASLGFGAALLAVAVWLTENETEHHSREAHTLGG